MVSSAKKPTAGFFQLTSELIEGTVDILTVPSLINLDFADLRTIMEHGGVSTILYGENADPDGVVRDAINSPLLDVDIRGGTGALIHISGGSNLTMRRANKIVSSITKVLDEDATVKFGGREPLAPGDDLGKVLGK